VIARSTGAFLVTLIALRYLFGDFEGGLDLLLTLLAAAVVGVAAGVFLERDARRGAPDVFDERATRQAVRRGVLRTALAAVAWVAVAVTVAHVVTGMWQLRGDRSEHFQFVSTYGFTAAHPGFRPASLGRCCPLGLRSLELELRAEPRTASGLGAPARVLLKLDLRGRLEDDTFELPRTGVDVAGGTGVDVAGGSGRVRTKPGLRRLLARLPDSLVATAVVELSRPLDPAGFYSFLAGHGVRYPESTEVAVYVQPGNPPGPYERDGFFANRVSWPNPSLAEFQHWVKQLRGSDDRLLDALRLPSSSRLRELAAEPRIHGFVLERATPAQLRGLLTDTAVESVSVGDVAFDLGTTR
jgi:hypothetical protein